MGKRRLRSGYYFCVCGCRLALPDVFQGRVGENDGILRHDAYPLAQRIQSHFLRWYAIDHDFAAGGVVEPQEQMKYGALPRTTGADQGDGLSWFDSHGKV